MHNKNNVLEATDAPGAVTDATVAPKPRREAPERAPSSPVQRIPLYRIRDDGGTQMRAGLNDLTIAEYRDWLRGLAQVRNGLDQMPPIVVYYDGTDYWLADGFHRLAAWKTADAVNGAPTIQSEVRAGTRRDAILHAAGANAAHGLRRTPADKWRAVEALLVDEEWGAWSDRRIAEACAVSPTFVGQVRAKLGSTDRPQYAPPPLPVTVHVDSDKRTYTTRHGTVAVMDTSKIGSGQRRAQQIKNGDADGDAYDWDFGCLTTVPPSDINFRSAIERADLETLRRALDSIPDGAGHTERRARLQARINRREREQRAAPANARTEDARAEPDLDAILRKIARDLVDWQTLLDDLAEGRRGWYDDAVLCYMPADVDRDLLAAAAKRVLAEMRAAQREPDAASGDEDPTPADLKAAGYMIEPFGSAWKFRYVAPDGSAFDMTGAWTPEQAIEWARRYHAIRTGSAAPAPPTQLVDYMALPADRTSPAVDDQPAGPDTPSDAAGEGDDPHKPITKTQESAAATAPAERCETLDRLANLYRAVLGALNDYERLTGYYTHTPPLKRALLPMLEAVQTNLAALSGMSGDTR
ncbi:MAG: hypothetical protein QM346_12310 [Chloroflexota bacterium]|nr:hypothetical protein [Chloroflexota bacterium]